MGLGHALSRRKPLDTVVGEQTELGKVLSTVDLIALGVGSTLGVGVYVLPGIVSRDIAGPGVFISFLYAAITSVNTGLCYAELGARIPRAGSAYIYSYVTMGELVAFIIGWNLIIQYIIGGASVARGLCGYLASLLGNIMGAHHDMFLSKHSKHSEVNPSLFDYIDILAFIIPVLVSIALAVGVKKSLLLNNLLTTVNCAVVLFVIIIGAIYADFMNWEIPPAEVPKSYGEGGFLPYGWIGTMSGASTCLNGFVGYDIIATSGEEARNPRRAIPVSIIVSLLIIFLAYSGVSIVLTLMWPYFLQDVDAPLLYVFKELDLGWAKWVVTIGGLFGLTASLFGGIFPIPRVVYAMSQDGLLFKFLGRVHPRFKTPFVGTILSGILIGTMAAFFSLTDLVNLMSMAILVCHTIVSKAVLILRYRTEVNGERFTSDSESSPLIQTPTFKRTSDPESSPLLRTPTFKKTSDPESSSLLQTPTFKRTSDPESSSLLQTPTFKRTSDPESSPLLQTPTFKRTSDPESSALLQTPTFKRTSDTESSALLQTPNFKRTSDTESSPLLRTPTFKRTSDPESSSLLQTPTFKRTSDTESSSLLETPTFKRTSDPESSPLLQTLTFKRTSDPESSSLLQTPTFKRTSDPESSPLLQTPTCKRTSDTESSALLQTPTFKRTSDTESSALLQTSTFKRTSDPESSPLLQTSTFKRTSDPESSPLLQTPTFKRTSDTESSPLLQTPTFKRTSDPESSPLLQTPTCKRTSDTESSALLQTPTFKRTSDTESSALLQTSTFKRTSDPESSPLLQTSTFKRTSDPESSPLLQTPTFKRTSDTESSPLLQTPTFKRTSYSENSPLLQTPTFKRTSDSESSSLLQTPTFKRTSDSKSLPLPRTPTFKRTSRPLRGLNLRKFPFANIEVTVYILTLCCALLAVTLSCMQNPDSGPTLSPCIAYTLLLIIAFILVMFARIPSHRPENLNIDYNDYNSQQRFKMPGLPLTPTLNIFINIYLMCHIDLSTWYRFFICLVAGLVIYFCYGLRHSTENQNRTPPNVEYESLQQSEQRQSRQVDLAHLVIKTEMIESQELQLGISLVH